MLNSLNKDEFADLIKRIKKEVREKVSVHNMNYVMLSQKRNLNRL